MLWVRASLSVWFLAAAAALASGCKGTADQVLVSCGVPGSVQQCLCPAPAPKAVQTCKTDGTWNTCQCAAAAAIASAGHGGSGGASGSTSTGSAGSAGSAGSGGSAGSAGSAGHAGSAGGGAGSGGHGAEHDAGSAEPPLYTACQPATGCQGTGHICYKPTGIGFGGAGGYCTKACSANADCPTEGASPAKPLCQSQTCRLDCSTSLACPAGLTCPVPFGSASCR